MLKFEFLVYNIMKFQFTILTKWYKILTNRVIFGGVYDSGRKT